MTRPHSIALLSDRGFTRRVSFFRVSQCRGIEAFVLRFRLLCSVA